MERRAQGKGVDPLLLTLTICIIPELEVTEEDVVGMLDAAVDRMVNGKPMEERTLDELDELEDDEDERVIQRYRQQRMQQMRDSQARNVFGHVLQISKPDYQKHVTDVTHPVVLFLFQDTLPDCKLVAQHLALLANLHKYVSFLKIVATQCIPGYPDKNCPTILIFLDGKLQLQLVGIHKMATPGILETVLLATKAINECKFSEEQRHTSYDDDEDDYS